MYFEKKNSNTQLTVFHTEGRRHIIIFFHFIMGSPEKRISLSDSVKIKFNYENVQSKLFHSTKAVLYSQREKVKFEEKKAKDATKRIHTTIALPLDSAKKIDLSSVQSKLFESTRATILSAREKVNISTSKIWKPHASTNRIDQPAPQISPIAEKAYRDRWSSVASRLFEPTTATKRGRWSREKEPSTVPKTKTETVNRSSSVPRNFEYRSPTRDGKSYNHQNSVVGNGKINGNEVVSDNMPVSAPIPELQKSSSPSYAALPSFQERLDQHLAKKEAEHERRLNNEKSNPKFQVKKSNMRSSQELLGSYIMYRKLVGESDGGTLLSDEEFHDLRVKAKHARKNKLCCVWRNTLTSIDCYSIGPDSRCFCGHMYKSHAWYNIDDKNVHCRVPDCLCPLFKYVNGNGTWFIRCTCKHSYQNHMASGLPSACSYKDCSCSTFYSDFCCSCGEGWKNHSTIFENESERKSLLLLKSTSPHSPPSSPPSSPKSVGISLVSPLDAPTATCESPSAATIPIDGTPPDPDPNYILQPAVSVDITEVGLETADTSVTERYTEYRQETAQVGDGAVATAAYPAPVTLAQYCKQSE